ncbi:hydrolase [Gordoniibacillus kamchatkensis]|uniref:Hydrolase n=1 Tax=Gordoniibacillus kamchatkensis TaxID=1590651 RepID=A0ABR5AAA4_9BACL|nr:MBL fold metallo-hydrolase [Paenibacillus sp. VKM B-2647]KIL37822.1 hydrolase [Paenibacillus sp. VKM B-2647]
MRIDQGIAMFSISAPVMGRTDTVHPVLLWDDRDVVLVDTGFPRQTEQLCAAAGSYGVDWERLNRIVITHQDIDHIGNLQDITEGAPGRIEVSAHPAEKPYIQGEKRLLRFTDEAIASIDSLPGHVPESFRKGLKALMLHPPRAAVDRIVKGGERLPWCGGIVVIDTPGHTPGHISLFHEPSRTLIAGDALVAQDGRLSGADPATTLDRPAAQASIAALCSYNIETVVCYHGGLCSDGVMERLAELAAESA